MSDDLSKIRKKARSCYNRCKANCSATYKTADEVCLYCLEFIIKIPRPKSLKINSDSKEIEIPKYEIKKFKFPIDLMEFSIKEPLHFIKVDYEGETSIILEFNN